jgi:hypothetical protein
MNIPSWARTKSWTWQGGHAINVGLSVQGSGLVRQVYGINVRRSCFAYDLYMVYVYVWFMCGLRMVYVYVWFMCGLRMVYVWFMYVYIYIYKSYIYIHTLYIYTILYYIYTVCIYLYIDPVTLHNRRIRYGLVTDLQVLRAHCRIATPSFWTPVVMVEPTVQNIGINRRHFAKLEYWKTHCHVCGWKRSLNVSGMSMQSIPPSSINSHQRKQSHFRKYQPNITKHQLAHACKPSPNSGFYCVNMGTCPVMLVASSVFSVISAPSHGSFSQLPVDLMV